MGSISFGQIVMDVANIIGCQREGAERSASASASRGRGRSVRQRLRNSCTTDGWMDGWGKGFWRSIAPCNLC